MMNAEERLERVLDVLWRMPEFIEGMAPSQWGVELRAWVQDVRAAAAYVRPVSREHEQAIADADYDEKHAAMKVLLRRFGWPNDAGAVMAIYPDLKAIMEPKPTICIDLAKGPDRTVWWCTCGFGGDSEEEFKRHMKEKHP